MQLAPRYRILIEAESMTGRACVAWLLGCAIATGQTPPAAKPAPPTQPASTAQPIHFEVASVRRNITGTPGGHGPTADGYDLKGMPAVFYVGMAFGVAEYQRIQGLPAWCQWGGETYDIAAKVAASDIPAWSKLDQDQFHSAIQALLADRFHLKAHFETRDAPVYALVVAKNGPKFKPSVPGDTYPGGIHTASGKLALGLGERWDPGSDRGREIGQAATMAALAQFLSSMMNPAIGRQVVDRTGLTGEYDFSFPIYNEWMSNHQDADNEASIFTVIEDSLGLRLEPAKAPMQFLVIDHIERPSGN
jgi:uncharacterized protein (TIGR03435 family)